ncbi:integrase catalytic domain-containing protein [Nephila pilipes]|uniref:Integrase catalytic domain-containing protein n=1 Tax=Nephila pilipes TaxID=299642 RepID=A0A8X6TH82_NEPPI|nr:integrase catalytic domain-containing protein [Nephila pilipes]
MINILANDCSTKRFILQILGRIFNPIGFLGPFIIRLKILLQELWIAEINWDNKLPFSLDYVSVAAYGCVIFLRRVTHDNRVIVKFARSKSRVTPLKLLTLAPFGITRMFLIARLSKQVSKYLKFEAKCYFWANSNICAYWIKGKINNYKPFVKNRVREIQNLTERYIWSHCPEKENPEYVLSIGIPASDLTKNSLWWHGPPWLSKPSELGQVKWKMTILSEI